MGRLTAFSCYAVGPVIYTPAPSYSMPSLPPFATGGEGFLGTAFCDELAFVSTPTPGFRLISRSEIHAFRLRSKILCWLPWPGHAVKPQVAPA